MDEANAAMLMEVEFVFPMKLVSDKEDFGVVVVLGDEVEKAVVIATAPTRRHSRSTLLEKLAVPTISSTRLENTEPTFSSNIDVNDPFDINDAMETNTPHNMGSCRHRNMALTHFLAWLLANPKQNPTQQADA